MVTELKKANDNNDERKSLSLKELKGKVKQDQIKIIKPALVKETDAIVEDVDIKIEMEEYKHNVNDESSVYHPGTVIVTTKFAHPETGEEVVSKDFFGGFRAYITENPETGEEEFLNFLPGVTGKNKGGLRRFVEAVQKDMTEDEEEKYNSWLSFFLEFLPGQKVKLKSEFTTYEGKTNIKQVIVGLRR